MTDLDNPLIAAMAASESVTELLRFHHEGPAGFTAFGEIEVCEKLAEALAIAIDIHLGDPGAKLDELEREDAAALRYACRNFIGSWA